MEKVKLFTHTDLDGVGCAIVARLHYGDINVDVEYCDYGEINEKVMNYLSEDNELHDKVFITDISVNEEVANTIDRLHQVNPTVFRLLDHHETALWLNKYKWSTVMIQDLEGKGTSGTSLLYKYLEMDNGLASFVESVRQYDTWEWTTIYNDKYPKQLNDLFYLYGRERFVDDVISKVTELGYYNMQNSELFLLQLEQERMDRYVRKLVHSANEITVGKYKLVVAYGDNYTNEVCHALLETFPEADIAVVINLTSKKISYRTDREGIDVSKFSKYFGGGGRTQTAGSEISSEDVIKITESIFNN